MRPRDMRRSPAPLTKHGSRTDHVQTPMDYQNLAPGNAGNAPLQALPLQESTPLPTAEDSAQTAMNQRTILTGRLCGLSAIGLPEI